MAKGIVYLIGAGPGDPKLITVRALECLRRAEVIVYDRLANPRLLREAHPEAEKIYVGKTADRHTLPQEEINQLLVDKALAGKIVVRLKGGDPFVFGRGGEEAEALAQAGIPFEVVPGVTSAIAAPAYAGIPVTHRDFNSALALVTGHEDPTKEGSSIDWAGLAKVGTVVFVMGVGNLPLIAAKLMEHGRSPQTPVALVRWGTTARQQTVSGTLADIAAKVEAAGLKPPAVTIVGEVVTLRESLRWFENKPLFGRRVLVTRAQASALSEKLEELGAEPIEFPVIEIVPPEDWGPLDAALERLPHYHWAIFTSVNGVRALLDRLWQLGQDVRALHGVRLCAIGPATAAELERYHLRVDLVPRQYVAESILESIGDVSGQRILLARADIARQVLPLELRRAGASVDEVTAYRTILADSPADDVYQMLRDGEIDIVTFTSSSTVRNFVEKIKAVEGAAWGDDLLDGVMVACIGPITAGTAQELGLKVDVIAEEYTIEGLVKCISEESI